MCNAIVTVKYIRDGTLKIIRKHVMNVGHGALHYDIFDKI